MFLGILNGNVKQADMPVDLGVHLSEIDERVKCPSPTNRVISSLSKIDFLLTSLEPFLRELRHVGKHLVMLKWWVLDLNASQNNIHYSKTEKRIPRPNQVMKPSGPFSSPCTTVPNVGVSTSGLRRCPE